MKRFKLILFAQVLSFIAIAFFVLPVNAGSVLAKEAIKATTKIKHKPIKYFVSEKRIKLEAKVTDKEGVSLVRCYFRAAEQADYVFVAMNAASSLYQGILPAPSKDTEMLEYLFLVVNGKNQVVKTQTFKINKKDTEKVPSWQQVSAEGDIHVSTELAQAPETLQGFTDSIVMDIVESSARFGTVAGGIYLASEAGGVSGAAAASTTAGTVTAGAGLSTAAIIGMGAAVAAGGAAAAGGGGGGGGGTDVTSHDVTICVIDHNSVQDDYYDLYVNGAYIGHVNNPTGGTTCHSATLRSGSNSIQLRLTEVQCCGTLLTITINPGGWEKKFSGTHDHEWTVTVP